MFVCFCLRKWIADLMSFLFVLFAWIWSIGQRFVSFRFDWNRLHSNGPVHAAKTQALKEMHFRFHAFEWIDLDPINGSLPRQFGGATLQHEQDLFSDKIHFRLRKQTTWSTNEQRWGERNPIENLSHCPKRVTVQNTIRVSSFKWRNQRSKQKNAKNNIESKQKKMYLFAQHRPDHVIDRSGAFSTSTLSPCTKRWRHFQHLSTVNEHNPFDSQTLIAKSTKLQVQASNWTLNYLRGSDPAGKISNVGQALVWSIGRSAIELLISFQPISIDICSVVSLLTIIYNSEKGKKKATEKKCFRDSCVVFEETFSQAEMWLTSKQTERTKW